jgi:hypothetical protein
LIAFLTGLLSKKYVKYNKAVGLLTGLITFVFSKKILKEDGKMKKT